MAAVVGDVVGSVGGGADSVIVVDAAGGRAEEGVADGFGDLATSADEVPADA